MVMVTLVLCAGHNVHLTTGGAVVHQINVMMGHKVLQRNIPSYATIPPSGEMSPALDTLMMVILLLRG